MACAARKRVGGRLPLLLVALAGGFGSLGCAPSSLRGRSVADPLDGPDQIVAIGRAGEIVYAVTRSRKLRAWDLRTRRLRTVDDAGTIAIARGGAVALGASDTLVRAFEPASGKPIATHRFGYGVKAGWGVSPAIAFVVVKRPTVYWPSNAAALPPPDWELVSWDLASGKIESQGMLSACDNLSFSIDGITTLCDLAWRDRGSGIMARPPQLAPEWAPSEPDPEPPGCAKCKPYVPETGYMLLSAWLSDDGRTAYVTYTRTVGGTEWRLDRWLPDPAGKTEGRVDHVAVSHEPIADRVVAASRDGRTILTNPGRRPPVLRHAPAYEGVPLLAPPVTAAAFSQDERFIVTGHGDGRLRLWEADSGRFEAISSD